MSRLHESSARLMLTITPGNHGADFLAHVDPAQLKAQGVTFVGVYLKNTTRTQIDGYHRHGIGVFLIHQNGKEGLQPNPAHWGNLAGLEANRQAAALGYPKTLPIVFASMGDYDNTPATLPGSVAYYRAAKAACLWPAGAYGDTELLAAVGNTALSCLAAAKVWSKDAPLPTVHLVQWPQQAVAMASKAWPGVLADRLDVLRPFTVWSPTTRTPTPKDRPMALPVITVVRPTAIQGLTAAQISKDNPTHLVKRAFPAVGTQYLNPQAARCWDALWVFCKQDTGRTLSCAGQGSGWRSYQTQVNAFRLRYTLGWTLAANGLTNRVKNIRTWNGTPGNIGPGDRRTYYLRKGMIPVAVPGGGYHPLGLALDVALHDPTTNTVRAIRSDPKVWNWLLANAASCGWSWENSSLGVDDPHLHYWAGDKIPARVAKLEAFFAAVTK